MSQKVDLPGLADLIDASVLIDQEEHGAIFILRLLHPSRGQSTTIQTSDTGLIVPPA